MQRTASLILGCKQVCVLQCSVRLASFGKFTDLCVSDLPRERKMDGGVVPAEDKELEGDFLKDLLGQRCLVHMTDSVRVECFTRVVLEWKEWRYELKIMFFFFFRKLKLAVVGKLLSSLFPFLS